METTPNTVFILYDALMQIKICVIKISVCWICRDESLDEGNSSPEELLLKVDCELISMMDSFPGRLEITNRCIYFFEHMPSSDDIGELSNSTESADYIISYFVFYEWFSGFCQNYLKYT